MQRKRALLPPVDHCLRPFCVGFFVEIETPPLRRVATHDRHHPSHLLGAHDRDFGRWPDKGEASAVGTATHAVVSGAVRVADDDREVRHRRVCNGVDHLRAVLGDATPLRSPCRRCTPVMLWRNNSGTSIWLQELDELGGLSPPDSESSAPLLPRMPTGEAMDRSPPANQGRPIDGLELFESASRRRRGR